MVSRLNNALNQIICKRNMKLVWRNGRCADQIICLKKFKMKVICNLIVGWSDLRTH